MLQNYALFTPFQVAGDPLEARQVKRSRLPNSRMDVLKIEEMREWGR